jgi:8-oxo-dGTP pyrophosphatase MutT (NUDIX family)
VREVWEETGLLVRPARLIGVYGGPAFVVRYPNGDETQYVSTFFECVVESGEPRADGDETPAVSFWTHREAVGLPLAPWLTKVLPRLYDAASDPWFEPSTWRP